MADDGNAGSLYYTVEADTDKLVNSTKPLNQSLDGVEKRFSKTDKSAGRLNTRTKKLSRSVREGIQANKGYASSFAALGKQILPLLGALSVAAAVRSSKRTIESFEQAIADLAAITGAAGDDLEYFKEQAADIGRTTSLSATEAAGAFKLIASAQPQLLDNAEALNAVTREAVTLAEATGMTLPNAAQALGGALNQFQLDASKASEVINVLAASSQLGTVEVESITQALVNAGSTANGLNIDLAETVAGLQALAKANITGSRAGTALNQVLLGLEKTNDKTLQPSVVGLVDALDELASRNLSNVQIIKDYGREALPAVQALLAQRDAARELNTTIRGTNTAYEQQEIRMDTLRGDARELMSSIEGLSIAMGEAGLTGALRTSTQSLTEFFRALTGFVEGDTIESVKTEIKELQDELEGRRFGRSAAASGGSGIEAKIDSLKDRLVELQAEDGNISATLQLVRRLNEELEQAESGGNQLVRGRGGVGGDTIAAGLREEIRDLEAGLFDSFTLLSDIEKKSNETSAPAVDTGGVDSDLAEEQERIQKAFDETSKSLEDQIKMLNMSERAAFAYQQVAQLGEGATQRQREEVELMAGALFDRRKELEREQEAVREAQKAEEEWNRTLEEGRRIMESTRTPMEDYKARLEEIDDLADQGALSEQNAMRARQAAWEDYQDTVNDTTDQVEQFAIQAARNIQSALGDSLFDALDGNFGDIADSFGNMLKRMAAEMAASAVLNSVASGLSGQGGFLGAIGNAISGSYASGGYTGNQPANKVAGVVHGREGVLNAQEIQSIGGERGFNDLRKTIAYGGGRQNGGPVDSGKFYRINESGSPEILNTGGKQYLMMNGSSGNVQNMQAGGGHGGNQISVAITVHSDGSVNTDSPAGMEQMGKQIGEFVDKKFNELVVKNKRQGGMLWNGGKR